ncbi:tail fiber domain-containing protein, partial [bacterium]|nr:tail fiber domain-containing protein [bacterium]
DWSFGITLVAETSVVSNRYFTSSDSRIKENIREVSNSDALSQIAKLRISKYQMRDVILHGDSPRVGLIAQEVERVIPDAVTRRPNVVPDVYQTSSKAEYRPESNTLLITVSELHGLSVGDELRVLLDNEPYTREILAVPDSKTIVVGEWEKKVEQVFVYGRHVEDFRTVNYDYVFTTGLAAIQELNSKLEASNKQLQSDLATVNEENAKLSGQLDSVMERLVALESLVMKSEEKNQSLTANLQ